MKVASYVLVMTKMPLGSSPYPQEADRGGLGGGSLQSWSNETILLSNPPPAAMLPGSYGVSFARKYPQSGYFQVYYILSLIMLI